MQYDRKVICRMGGLSINEQDGDQLKVGFNISKDISSTANDASVQIWNLSESHRNSVGKEFQDIEIEAGYNWANNIGLILKAQIRDVTHTREGPDIITTIECGEGDKANRKATVSKSFPKGTNLKTVVEYVQERLEEQGVKRGEWRGIDKLPNLERPLAIVGSAKRELDMIMRSYGYYWSIQNGATEIIPSDEAFDQIVYLSNSTGLIGVPSITDNGCKVRCLLNPNILPNHQIQIESDVLEMNAANGLYRVSSVTYTGDNRDGEMACDITGESISGGKVDEGEI